jgi:hypothetical protein
MNVQCYLIIRVHGKYWNGIDVFIFEMNHVEKMVWILILLMVLVTNMSISIIQLNFNSFYKLVSWKIFNCWLCSIKFIPTLWHIEHRTKESHNSTFDHVLIRGKCFWELSYVIDMNITLKGCIPCHYPLVKNINDLKKLKV